MGIRHTLTRHEAVFDVHPFGQSGIGADPICGNSAIVATAPVLEANEEEVRFAVATITLFGLLAVLVYPYAGHLVGLTDRAFGLWAGTAENDTSQVVAVGSIFSEAALNVATVVKLTRNTLMAPLIVLFGLVYARGFNRDMSDEAAQASSFNWRKVVPGFVIGFLLMSLVRTVGVALLVLPQSVSEPGDLIAAASFLKTCEEISRFAILMALAGVGLNTDFVSLRRIGLKPLLVGTCVAVVLALVSLGLDPLYPAWKLGNGNPRPVRPFLCSSSRNPKRERHSLQYQLISRRMGFLVFFTGMPCGLSTNLSLTGSRQVASRARVLAHAYG